jgi:protoporphyrin/coproporphyrin ferrochelatase
MPDRRTGILLLGFGGPEPGCCGRRAVCGARGPGAERACAGADSAQADWTPRDEAACFVSAVLDDDPARRDRVEEVATHYRAIHAATGAWSPYNQLTRAQAAALAAALPAHPVALGLRHWTPSVGQALGQLAAAGCAEALPVILAPHQSGRGWQRYVDDAQRAAAAPGLPRLLEPFPALHDDPGLIAASAERLRSACAGWDPARRSRTDLILTAHAIPAPAERGTPYRAQIEAGAAAIAAAAGWPRATVAFTSAPPTSAVPWSAPRVEDALAAAAAAGRTDVLVMTVGFLVDHVEVLYDLDVAARAEADRLGLTWTRAPAVHDHPAFIASLAERITAHLG